MIDMILMFMIFKGERITISPLAIINMMKPVNKPAAKPFIKIKRTKATTKSKIPRLLERVGLCRSTTCNFHDRSKSAFLDVLYNI